MGSIAPAAHRKSLAVNQSQKRRESNISKLPDKPSIFFNMGDIETSEIATLAPTTDTYSLSASQKTPVIIPRASPSQQGSGSGGGEVGDTASRLGGRRESSALGGRKELSGDYSEYSIDALVASKRTQDAVRFATSYSEWLGYGADPLSAPIFGERDLAAVIEVALGRLAAEATSALMAMAAVKPVGDDAGGVRGEKGEGGREGDENERGMKGEGDEKLARPSKVTVEDIASCLLKEIDTPVASTGASAMSATDSKSRDRAFSLLKIKYRTMQGALTELGRRFDAIQRSLGEAATRVAAAEIEKAGAIRKTEDVLKKFKEMELRCGAAEQAMLKFVGAQICKACSRPLDCSKKSKKSVDGIDNIKHDGEEKEVEEVGEKSHEYHKMTMEEVGTREEEKDSNNLKDFATIRNELSFG